MAISDLSGILEKVALREAADPESYPAETIADLHALGFLRAPFARDHGGEACTLVEATRAVEDLAAASGSAALMASMPLGLAGVFASVEDQAPAAHRQAWHDQRERIATEYRAGRLFAACNSEKGAGGSLAATKTVASRDAAGAFRLTGEKILASSGNYADTFFSTAKVDPAELPGCGVVELFFVPVHGEGVTVLNDWDGFGMRSTESHTVRYEAAAAREMMGFPDFIDIVKPLQYWFCLFSAIPLGCARAVLDSVAKPWPASPALRIRLEDGRMRYEALRAYLLETAGMWRPGAPAAYQARVLRTKTYVSAEATKLAAEMFALGGGGRYRRGHAAARALADSFAGTALRPPLPLGLEALGQSEVFDF